MASPTIFANVALSNAVPSSMMSTVGEPSTAKTGGVAMYSGNWYAARSFDGGATWQHLDPFTYFPDVDDGFCCDQTLIYDESRDLFIWLLQYSTENGQNTLRVAVCPSAEVQNDGWQFWDLVPVEVNANWSNEWFDYNHAALSDNFLYVGSNMFNVEPERFTRSIVFRLSLDELRDGQALTLDLFTSNDFSLRCTLGATDTMYFGAHVNTSQIRVYAWPEQDASVTSTEIDITDWRGPPYSAPQNNAGNWMGRATERITAAWTTGGEVGFMWTANRQGIRRPQPFARGVCIDAASMTLIDEPDIWHSDVAFAWPETSPNSRGDVAVSLFLGGGDFHPSHVIGFCEKGQTGWQLALSNTGTHSPNDGKWGDYLHTRLNLPDRLSWVTSAFSLQGGGDRSNIEPRFVHFGLDSDAQAITGGTQPATS
jgi:hypothetical protein